MEKKKEPQIVIRPIGRFGGLDNIHISLIILVAILVALLAVISYSKPQVVTNSTNVSSVCSSFCANQISTQNETLKPIHTEGEVINYTERILATYNFINLNSSLGVYLPFYSNVSQMNASYIPSSKEWHVIVPVKNPITNATFYASFDIYDRNLSLDKAYIQTVYPKKVLSYQVVYPGVLLIPGKFACNVQKPMQVFWFIDPYAPGSVYSLEYIPQLLSKYGENINVTIKILFGSYTDIIASRYGPLNAQELGKYILCASQQKNFSNFIFNLNALYSNSYINNQTLGIVARSSSLNLSQLNSCIANSTTLINRQALLAEYYNITSTPAVVVDCRYLALPQTVQNALCFVNSTFCK